MMGRDHALSGALVGLAAVDPLASALGHPLLSPLMLAGAAATTAGFALLPDIDEPNSTVSRKLGPVSRGVSNVTKRIAGGHRMATHSLLFAAATFGLAALAGHFVYAAPIVVWAALSLSVALVVPGVWRHGLISLLVPIVAAAGILHAETGAWHPAAHLVLTHGVWWVPWAAGIGVLCHLVGDALTTEGVPLFWPHKKRLALPILGHTSSLRESALGLGLAAGVLVLGWLWVVHPELGHAQHLVGQIRGTVSTISHAVTTVRHAVSQARQLQSRLSGLAHRSIPLIKAPR